MVDIADYYRNQELDKEFNYYQRIEEPIWTCKDGTQIAISDMTNNHIINAINMVNRNLTSKKSFQILAKELKNRGLKIPKINPLFDCDATEIDIY